MKKIAITALFLTMIFCLCACGETYTMPSESENGSSNIEINGFVNLEDLLEPIETAIETVDFGLINNNFHSEAVAFTKYVEGITDAETFKTFLNDRNIEQEVTLFKADKEYLVSIDFDETVEELENFISEYDLNIDTSSLTLYRIDMYSGDTDDEFVLFCKENGAWKILTLCLSA